MSDPVIEDVAKDLAPQETKEQEENGSLTTEQVMTPKVKMQVVPDDDKDSIRKKVWDHIEKNNLANFPRPVHQRIPNFKGANIAADGIVKLDVYTKARAVKVNPDKPQEQLRFRTLESMKNLYVPTPRLRSGLLNKITPPPNYDRNMLKRCATSLGTRDHSIPIGLDDKLRIDLVVVGSVAVSPSGLRIGKGEGFGDLEFGMLMTMGAVNEDTTIVTTVHDDQILELPENLFGIHDMPVDMIVTPTQVIQCSRRSRPPGIMWSLMTLEKLQQCPVLQDLRRRHRSEGRDVTLKDGLDPTDEELEEALPVSDDRPQRPRPYTHRRGRGRGGTLQLSHMERQVTEMITMTALIAGDGAERGDGRSQEPNNRQRRGGGPRRRRPLRSVPHEGLDGGVGPEGDAKLGHTPNIGNGPESAHRPDSAPHARRLPQRRPPRVSNPAAGPPHVGNPAAGEAVETHGPAQAKRDKPSQQRNDKNLRPNRARRRPPGGPAVFIGSIPRELRVSSFKTEVRGKDVNPIRVIWRGGRGFAILQFTSGDEMDEALKALEGLNINGKDLKVEKSTNTRKPKEKNDESKISESVFVQDPMACGDAVKATVNEN